MLLLAAGLMLLGVVMALFSPQFADTAIRVSAQCRAGRCGIAQDRVPRRFAATGAALEGIRCCCGAIPGWCRRRLMQLLYLVPPALMLWRSFSDSSTAIVLITPVIVMAAGQLAGGLAWLTISGEDAADLVATAPLSPSQRDPRQDRGGADRDRHDVRAAGRRAGVCLAAAGGRHRAWRHDRGRHRRPRSSSGSGCRRKRSQFRRRQTSSRLATFAEAFSSIGWAATAALVLTIPIAAVISGLLTTAILAATWKISPRRG